MEDPQNTKDTGRNADGTFKPGFSGNPGGRPRGGLKDYDRKRFIDMTDEEKDRFLSQIPPEIRYKMAEGNPHTTEDHKVEVTLPKPLLDRVLEDNSPQESPSANEAT